MFAVRKPLRQEAKKSISRVQSNLTIVSVTELLIKDFTSTCRSWNLMFTA